MNLPIIDDDFKILQIEYAQELPELIDSVESHLMSIEDSDENEKSLKELRRIVHSIKGTAGSYELGWVSSLCHQFEDQLDDLVEKNDSLPKGSVQTFLNYIDLFRNYVKDFLSESLDLDEYNKNLHKLRGVVDVSGETERRKKVLIIESASTLLKAYKLLISSVDMDYATAMSGREGFERLLIEEYDYLITGHATGVVDGPSLIAITKVFNGASKGVKTILTTSIDELDLSPDQMPDFLVEKKLGMMEKIKDIFVDRPVNTNDLTFKRVLCIDDDNSILKLLKLAFSKQDGVEFHFSNLLSSSDLENFNPDLILLDYFIEDRTGVEILEDLRSKYNYSGDVVFLTGATKDEELTKIFNSSALGVIEKPFIPKRLYSMILDLVAKAA
jgi:CheY-like chemotaxis protein/HPt (histidine-containing phosphotransfer) domain-containing protein